ncbi:hypothetical protein FIBSPDRAFT_663930, partial [Athelia psychrophila]
SWLAGLHWIRDLNIPGFMSGLTLLQTAHNLTLLQILEPPTAEAISTWMYGNPKLGAQWALTKMGFKIHDGKFMEAAVKIVYKHMDGYMTEEDKELMAFGQIFNEHILCKDI